MKIRLEELLAVEKPLSDLLEKNLPIKISYQLSKLVHQVATELRGFYEARDRLITNLGKEAEDGSYFIDKDDREKVLEYQTQIKELIEVEVDLPGYSPISIDELSATKIELSAMQMAALQKFFTEE